MAKLTEDEWQLVAKHAARLEETLRTLHRLLLDPATTRAKLNAVIDKALELPH